MKGEATEEDREHKSPFEILIERIEERTFANTISHDGKRYVTKAIEDNEDTEPHLPRVNIVLIQVTVEPADEEVIYSCHNPGCTNGVVGTNVRDNGNLGREANVAEQKPSE